MDLLDAATGVNTCHGRIYRSRNSRGGGSSTNEDRLFTAPAARAALQSNYHLSRVYKHSP